MEDQTLLTEFAPSGRASKNDLTADVDLFTSIPVFGQFIRMIPDLYLILNQERQVVYANQALLEMLNIQNADKIYGLRPGEVLDCIHANATDGGCGTTAFCRYCGAVNAILSSQVNSDRVFVEECRITTTAAEAAFDFRVWAKGMVFNKKPYTIFIVRDISDEKRRLVLEKTFFHDILNTAGGIQGVVEILSETSGADLDELISLVETASETMIEEIQVQKDLLAAEAGDLVLSMNSVNSMEILMAVNAVYKKHEVAEGKTIVIDSDADSIDFLSDSRILKRIISNMLKNALEATLPGETVTMSAVRIDKYIEFKVNNPAVMPEEIQMQMFQRSFSTKGPGRGIGSYSIKMFGEKYLNGKVLFSSEEGYGTSVFLQIPCQ